MTLIWLRDHVLPGLITAAIIGASHYRLRRHISKVTDQQTRTLTRDDTEEHDHG